MSLSSKKCCVPGCLESGGMKAPLHLFPNPVKDKERFNMWVFYIRGDIIGMDDDDIYKHRRVCHAHFEEKFCCRNDRLSNIALPTLHLPGSTSMPKFSFAERRPLRQTENVDSEHILPSTSRTPTENKYEHPAMKRHSDHTYCEVTSLKIARSTTSELLVPEDAPSTLMSPAGTNNRASELVVPEAGPSTLVSTPHKTNRALQYHLNEENSDRGDGNEVIIDGVFDSEPEVTKSLDGPFTWQQKPYVFGDDTEKVSDDESTIDDIFPRNESPLTEPRNISTDDPEALTEHTDYVCNECGLPIYGARYKCVQCLDYDVCVECEARGAHAAHYALRVPRGSPQDQVRRVIDAIKRCLNENEPEMMIPEIEEIKDEIKEETSDVEECDPLHTFNDQQVPKPGDIDIDQEDRAHHAHLKTNASSSITQTVTNVVRKTDSNILRQTDDNVLHKTHSNMLEQYVNDSYIRNYSDANLTQPNNTYLLLDINKLQEIDKNFVSCQTDSNVTAQTNTYFLYENVLYQTGPTLINQTDINEIDLTGTKEVDQFGANIIYINDTNKLDSLKTKNALPHVSQVISDSTDIHQKLVPTRKTHLHTSGNSPIDPLLCKKIVITPMKRDLRGNLLLNKIP